MDDKYYLGIDIGSNGGIVVLNQDGSVKRVDKMPENRLELYEILAKFAGFHRMCVIEHVHGRPQNGGKANFTFGMFNEKVLYSLEITNTPYQAVTPPTWLKIYMLKKDKGETNTQWKNRLKARAKQLFPEQNITLWNADAFLIAEYCRRNMK